MVQDWSQSNTEWQVKLNSVVAAAAECVGQIEAEVVKELYERRQYIEGDVREFRHRGPDQFTIADFVPWDEDEDFGVITSEALSPLQEAVSTLSNRIQELYSNE